MEKSEAPEIEPSPRYPIPPPPSVSEIPQKSPVLAAFLSVVPGLGNIYNGFYRRAIVFFLVYLAFLVMMVASAENGNESALAFFIPCMIFIWLFNIFDAYRQATLLNYGFKTDLEEANLNVRGWGLAPGVFLLVLGLYGLLRNYFNIDWDWLLEQWPWGVIGLGAWMIYQHVKERAKANPAGI